MIVGCVSKDLLTHANVDSQGQPSSTLVCSYWFHELVPRHVTPHGIVT